MSLTKAQKSKILEKLSEDFKKAKMVAFSTYQGTGVKDLQELRKLLRKEGAHYRIAKKTLIRKAGRSAGFPDLSESAIPGAVGVAIGFEDEVAPARVVHSFGKTHEHVALLGGIMEGRLLNIQEVKYLATLPGKDELIAKLVYMLNSPIAGFHGVLHAVMRSFVYALSEIQRKKTA